jgi:hypothetical protein
MIKRQNRNDHEVTIMDQFIVDPKQSFQAIHLKGCFYCGGSLPNQGQRTYLQFMLGRNP